MLELNQLYNMDCMEGMAAFPDKYFNLAVIDPPYGIGADKDMHKKAGTQHGKSRSPRSIYHFADFDKEPPPPEYFTELMRVSQNQIIFGANHFISRLPLDASCWIVWDKENGSTDFADCELAWTSFKSAVRIFRFKWNGMLQGNMKNKEKRIHPTQKPVALYLWIYQMYAKPGYKIIDTHAGSAPSFVAAYDMGFEYIGFEKDEGHYIAAAERMDAVMSQIRFDDLLPHEAGGGVQLHINNMEVTAE